MASRVRDIGEVTAVTADAELCCRREPSLPDLAAALFVPLFRVEEEQLVLLDRSAYGKAVIVAAKEVLLSANSGIEAVGLLLAEEIVGGIERIVPAEVIRIAVKLVATSL